MRGLQGINGGYVKEFSGTRIKVKTPFFLQLMRIFCFCGREFIVYSFLLLFCWSVHALPPLAAANSCLDDRQQPQVYPATNGQVFQAFPFVGDGRQVPRLHSVQLFRFRARSKAHLLLS